MEETKQTLVEQARQYVREYFLNHLPPSRLFHNYDNTTEIVEVCEYLVKEAGYGAEAKNNLVLAAWFLDTGYTEETDEAEVSSARIAVKFLRGAGISEEMIEAVEQLILSMGAEYPPQSTESKILHDARWAFLGRKRFFKKAGLLRLEKEGMLGKKFTQIEWDELMLDLLISRKFFSSWAQKKYSPGRSNNISKQRENVVKASETTIRKKTGKDFGRGVDTVYRITLRNHINLSSIADGKANMIININTLILSFLIAVGGASFSLKDFTVQNSKFIIPGLVLMLSSLATIIFAILSAIPKVSRGPVDEESLRTHSTSLLYFGNFLQLEKEAFVAYLRDLKTDQEVLYDDLSRDLYNLGLVLQKKYRLLSISYRLFMAGLILSVLTFLVVFFI